ncbi:amidohydrolase family protein [Salinimicrobium soli]|uniref:amidohydrolase family protein n=1 Tax=Salinimicrobium soli TaxID=1254399 RepID=UPI003AAB2D0D
MKKITWAVFIVLLSFNSIKAQDDPLAPVTGTVAVTNVTIIPQPGKIIENGTVLVRDGIIEAVGKNVSVPAGARVVKADSLYLYPGFILGLSHSGIKMPEKKDTPKVKDPGNPPNDFAGITPERKVYQFFDAKDNSIESWRDVGFTIAQTAPKGGMLPGTASVILLKENNKNGSVLKSGTGLLATFDGAQRMYPATILGVMAEYRQLFRRAEQAQEYSASYDKDPSGRQRPVHDVVLEAFYPVIEEKIPVLFKAEDILEAQRAMLLKKDLDFELVLTELKEGWDLMDDIKSSGAAVQFSLDLPEWKETKKDSAATKEASEEKKMLESRRENFMKKYYGQMGQFAAAGIPFAFSGLEVKPGDVQKNLQKMVEQGLSEDAALAALTTTPASMLGLERTAGTVETGKMANLIISNKPYFSKDAKIKYIMVEGVLFEKDLKAAKKADASTIELVAGEWTYESTTPGGPMTGTLILKKEDNGELSGTISNTLTSEESVLNDLLVTKDRITFNFNVVFQGQALTVEASLTVKGDSFEGSLNGGGESFPIEGFKVPQLRSKSKTL